MDRKNFLRQTVIGAGGLISLPYLLPAQNPVNKKGEPLPAEKVREFVGAGHNNLDKVKSLIGEFPTILYATWDWGTGDFETAIEAAGHVGDKAIANYLIGKGARINLFVLTMLGKTALVKSWLDAYPEYLYARGPHGYTLLHHAQRGGEEAKELVEYLQGKGLKEPRMAL